ncbi:pyridoxamine 5'-phosphate oxidase-domain-containing protein [Catenaria anguillulae PL171]|nr:pyridoxamine 5'-phosphate oxidase-domain-containing protein [Catenaria anguillulae PL171]
MSTMSAHRWIDRLHASLASNFAVLGHPVKYVQLATCGTISTPASPLQSPSWAPRVRTVVFRGLVANGTAHFADDWIKTSPHSVAAAQDELVHLLFVTDLRTRKVTEIKDNPLVEVCWYFSHSREQFRLSGVGVVVDGNASTVSTATSSKVNWQQVRERMWAVQSPAAKQTYLDSKTSDAVPSSDLAKVSSHFGLVYVTVNHVDHLDLRNAESQGSTVWALRQGEYHALRSTL